MKVTLSKEQLGNARMVGDSRFGKVCNYIQLATGERYGSTMLCRSTKNLVVEEFPHLIVHNSSSYASWGCRCSVCKAARAVRIKPYNDSYSDERHLINKVELKNRIMEELNMNVYECASCQSKTKLEADHIHAGNKLMGIDSFKDYLNNNNPELQDFISAEIKKCQVLCQICHNKSKGSDLITGRARNLASTPWLVGKINGKPISRWIPTQIIPLLRLLGYKPGNTPRPLSNYKWKIYRTYAASINKPSI